MNWTSLSMSCGDAGSKGAVIIYGRGDTDLGEGDEITPCKGGHNNRPFVGEGHEINCHMAPISISFQVFKKWLHVPHQLVYCIFGK